MRSDEPIGYTIAFDGKINYEFFVPSLNGIHQAAKDFGLTEDEYEVVPLFAPKGYQNAK